ATHLPILRDTYRVLGDIPTGQAQRGVVGHIQIPRPSAAVVEEQAVALGLPSKEDRTKCFCLPPAQSPTSMPCLAPRYSDQDARRHSVHVRRPPVIVLFVQQPHARL